MNLPRSLAEQMALESARAIEPLRTQWLNALDPVFESWRKQGAQFARTLQDLSEHLAALPEHVQAGSELLAARGWYLDHEFPVGRLRKIRERLEQGDGYAVDDAMSDYYETSLSDITAKLIDKYPHRAAVLKAALDALANRQSILAIPVLLAQSDGICVELLNAKLFQKRKGKPQVAEKIEALSIQGVAGVFLSVLSLPGGIAASAEFRDSYPHCLNRHEILHGLDSGYGTDMNGWKALSLLSFVALLVPMAIRDAEHESR